MNETQILELGKEVGLSPDVLRQALAEERGRTLVPAESGLLASLAGPAAVSAARTVPGSAAAVLSALDGWMQRSEGLEVKRRFTDQLVWEARRDVFAAFRRALSVSRSGLELAAAESVTAIVADVAPGQSHARIVADFRAARRQRGTTALGLALFFGALISGSLVAVNIQPVLAIILGCAIPFASLLVTRSRYTHLVARAQVALEQALDRLEFASDRPATTAQVLLDAIIGPPRAPK